MSAKVATPVSPVHLAWAMAPAFTPRTINTMEDEGYRSSEDIEGKSFVEPEASMATSVGLVPYNKDPPVFYENLPPEPKFTDDNEPFVFGIFRAPSSSSSVTSSPTATPMTAPATPYIGSAFTPIMVPAAVPHDQAKQTPTTGFAERFLPRQYDGESGVEDDHVYDSNTTLDVKKQRKGLVKKLNQRRRQVGGQIRYQVHYQVNYQVQPQVPPIKETLRMIFADMLPETFFLGKSVGDWREKFMPLRNEALAQLLRMLERNGEDDDYTPCLVSRVRDETMPEVPSIIITDPEGRDIVLAN